MINGNATARLVAVDPQTNVELGNPFDVVLPRALSDRLADLNARDELGMMILRGTLNPNAQGQLASARRPIFHPIEAPQIVVTTQPKVLARPSSVNHLTVSDESISADTSAT